MNLDFTDDQNMLRDEVRKFLTKEHPVGNARTVIEEKKTHDEAAWNGLVEMGVTGIMLPESCGGHGMGALELCVVAEEIGRQLATVPLSSTMYLAAQAFLLGSSEAQQKEWLPRVAEGQIGTVAAPLDGGLYSADNLPSFDGSALNGTVSTVADGGIAQFAVVMAKDSSGKAVLVAADLEENVEREAQATVDPSRNYAKLTFNGTAATALDNAADAVKVLEKVRDRAAILMAFEQLGAADSVLEISTEYAKERKAFGRTIGSYQGVKHKLVDIFTNNQMARSHCYYGAWALNSDAEELPLAAAGARISSTQALAYAAQESIQAHGGMGFTWEVDCQLFYKRARLQALALGSIHEWREYLADTLEANLKAA